MSGPVGPGTWCSPSAMSPGSGSSVPSGITRTESSANTAVTAQIAVKWIAGSRPTLAASAPRPAPITVPMLQAAWKPGIRSRPASRSTM